MTSKLTGEGDEVPKMSESQTKAGNHRKFEKFENFKKFENLKFKIAQVDPRDMLNNFCFHVYAQKSLFIAENCNAFFWTSSAPYPVILEFIELVPS